MSHQTAKVIQQYVVLNDFCFSLNSQFNFFCTIQQWFQSHGRYSVSALNGL